MKIFIENDEVAFRFIVAKAERKIQFIFIGLRGAHPNIVDCWSFLLGYNEDKKNTLIKERGRRFSGRQHHSCITPIYTQRKKQNLIDL